MRCKLAIHTLEQFAPRHAAPLLVLLLCLLATHRIDGEDLDAKGEIRLKSAASTYDDLHVVVFSQTDPSAAVLIIQNKGHRTKKNLRCIVRLDSNLRRVARGDSLLLKPTYQLNKYKLVVGTLGPGESKRFEFPVLVEPMNQKEALFSVQFGSDWRSTGIGIANQAVANRLPPVDAEWGVLTGRFVFDGVVPVLRKVPIRRNAKIFGEHTFDESLLVHKKNRGISNVVISLHAPRNQPKIHPGFGELPHVLLQVANGQFYPRISLLRTNQELTILNRDEVAHSVKVDTIRNPPLNPVLGPGHVTNLRFQRAEPLPVPLSGTIHPWLFGKLVVTDHPYVAKTDRNGRFEIRNLPPGKHQFRVWHERGGYVTEVSVQEKEQAWPKGLFPFEIKKGNNDVGKIIAAADQFD